MKLRQMGAIVSLFLGNCTSPVDNDEAGEKLIKLIFVQF